MSFGDQLLRLRAIVCFESWSELHRNVDLNFFRWPFTLPIKQNIKTFEEAHMATVLARGRKQVGELEVVLGGKPPSNAITQSKAALTKYVRDYFAQRDAEQSQFGKLMAKSRQHILSSLRKDDPTLDREVAEAKEFLKERALRPIAKLKTEKMESQLVIGSQFTAKGPPFDFEWTSGSEAHANRNSGTYDVAVQSIGSKSREAAAGVGVWFYSTEADPAKRYLAVLHFSYDWWDSSSFCVAHNNYRTEALGMGRPGTAVGRSGRQGSPVE
jgi:hypothetical protein